VGSLARAAITSHVDHFSDDLCVRVAVGRGQQAGNMQPVVAPQTRLTAQLRGQALVSPLGKPPSSAGAHSRGTFEATTLSMALVMTPSRSFRAHVMPFPEHAQSLVLHTGLSPASASAAHLRAECRDSQRLPTRLALSGLCGHWLHQLRP